ncbi:MAG: hypothetical protein ABJG33_14505 [Balneola sp.]
MKISPKKNLILLIFFFSLNCTSYNESELILDGNRFSLEFNDFNLNVSSSVSDISPCLLLNCQDLFQIELLIEDKSIDLQDYLNQKSKEKNLYFDFKEEQYREEFLINNYLIEYYSNRNFNEYIILKPLKYITLEKLVNDKLLEEIKKHESKLNRERYLARDQVFEINRLTLNSTFSKSIYISLVGKRVDRIIID